MATIVTRSGKGSPLTNTEVDNNFTNINTDKQEILSEGAFADGDKTKLDGIEAGADVTDTANVTAAGALMDSEVTNLAQVKAFDSADYATAAQGTLADSALQDITSESIKNLSDVYSAMSPTDGQVLTYDTTNGWQSETPSGGVTTGKAIAMAIVFGG